MNFVNYRGELIGLIDHGRPVKPKQEKPAEYHNGWRVQGIPPGALDDARQLHAEEVRRAGSVPGAKMPKPWDEGAWLMNAKRKPVRSKPYEAESAARECATLAEKCGWLRVEVVEIARRKGAGEA